MKKNEIDRAFGKFLAKKRKQAGLTQIELAKKLGYDTAQFVSNFERGVAAPALAAVSTISKHCDVPYEYFRKWYVARAESELVSAFVKAKK